MLVTAASWAAAGLAVHAAVNTRRLRVPQPAPATRIVPGVSVLIPARDEAHHIEGCIEAALASKGVVLEVLVLDDESSDDTAARVEAIAQRDRRVRLLRGAGPPSGWLGKPFACWQLAQAAKGDVLAFVDADVRVEPDAVARSVALLEQADLDLVSPYPRQVAGTPAERLVQPLLQWSWLTFLPLRRAEISPRPSLVAANGQLLVCRRRAYEKAGGHEAVRGAVLEDIELARAFKTAGLRATVADGTDLATCRMYEGWGDVRDGYTKSLWAATHGPAAAALLGTALLWLYVLPPAALVWRLARRRSLATPALGYAAGVAGRVVAARRTGGSVADAAAHPLSILILVSLGVRSHVQHRRGSLTWKGRRL